jgi:hypothetical protein
MIVNRPGADMQTERKPRLVRLRPEYAELYKGKLEIGRDYHGLFSLYHPDYMSIMGTTVDRADKRHFDIEADAETG